MLRPMLVLLLFITAGCRSEGTPQNPTHAKPALHSAEPVHEGVIVCRLEYMDRVESVTLEAPYAIFPVWNDSETLFYLYDKSQQETYKTSDFEEFLTRIEALPQGIEVLRYSTCCAGSAFNMPDTHWRRLEQVMTAGNRHWTVVEEPEFATRIICTCETRNIQYP